MYFPKDVSKLTHLSWTSDGDSKEKIISYPAIWCDMWWQRASQAEIVVKTSSATAGDVRDAGLIPGSGRSPGGGNGNPLQYSCLENPMDRGAWRATVHKVRMSWTQAHNVETKCCEDFCIRRIHHLSALWPWASPFSALSLSSPRVQWGELINEVLYNFIQNEEGIHSECGRFWCCLWEYFNSFPLHTQYPKGTCSTVLLGGSPGSLQNQVEVAEVVRFPVRVCDGTSKIPRAKKENRQQWFQWNEDPRIVLKVFDKQRGKCSLLSLWELSAGFPSQQLPCALILREHGK